MNLSDKNRTKVILIGIASLLAFYAFFLIITFVYPSNFLLQKPKIEIFTPKDRIKKDWREAGFTAMETKNRLTAYVMEKDKNKRDFFFSTTYFGKLPNQLSEEQKKLFHKKTTVIGDKPIILYEYKTGTISKKGLESWNKTYNEMLTKKTKLTKKQLYNPQTIDATTCAKLLENKRFLFYTGSGISIAAGIPSGATSRKNIGFDDTKEVDQLVINILTNPQKIIDEQKKFEATFRNAKPTSAHKALANIGFSHNAHIITSNIDKLHEQSGIRPWNAMTSHTTTYLLLIEKPTPVSGNYPYLKANPQWLKDMDFVICIGMGSDVKGFLAGYKKHNPKGKIIAINKTAVPYLQSEDYFLQGDIQEIVPALEKKLKKD